MSFIQVTLPLDSTSTIDQAIEYVNYRMGVNECPLLVRKELSTIIVIDSGKEYKASYDLSVGSDELLFELTY
jgi:hypothetical protein